MAGTVVDVDLAVLPAITRRTITLVSKLVQWRAPPIMMTRRRLTRNVLRITIPPRVPRLTHTSVRPVCVEAPSMVTRAGATRTFDHVFGTSGASEARGTGARVASCGGVISYAAPSVSTGLGRAVVFVGAFVTCIARRTIAFVSVK